MARNLPVCCALVLSLYGSDVGMDLHPRRTLLQELWGVRYSSSLGKASTRAWLKHKVNGTCIIIIMKNISENNNYLSLALEQCRERCTSIRMVIFDQQDTRRLVII